MGSLKGSLSDHREFGIEGLPCTCWCWSFSYPFAPFWPTTIMPLLCFVSVCPIGIKYHISLSELLIVISAQSRQCNCFLLLTHPQHGSWHPQIFWVPGYISDPPKDVYISSSAIGLPHLGHQKSSGNHIHSHHTNFHSFESLQELLDFFKITLSFSGIKTESLYIPV